MTEWLKVHAWKVCLRQRDVGSNPSSSSNKKKAKGYEMSDQKVYLDDIYASEKCEGSPFKAVVMMSHEARFINDQARQGFIELEKKPTTIAMYKFKENRLEMSSLDEPKVVEPTLAVDEEMSREVLRVAEEEKTEAADFDDELLEETPSEES